MEFLTRHERFKRSRPARGAMLCLMVMALVVCEPAFLATASAKTIAEDQLPDLNAALVLKIAMFVEWPDNGAQSGDGIITVGIVGDDTVFGAFRNVAHKKIKGRVIDLNRYLSLSELEPNRILFISRDSSFDQESLQFGALTIGDAPDFNARGGMIQLGVKNGRPWFSINLEAAEAVGIDFSSQLLKIATIYKGESL